MTDRYASSDGQRQASDGRVRRCPECDSTITVLERESVVCSDCGTVFRLTQPEYGPDWWPLTHAERRPRARVGAPARATISETDLSSTHDETDRGDAAGRSLAPRQRTRMQRLDGPGSNARSLTYALGELDRMATSLGLPVAARETAGMLYRRALEADLVRGRSIEGVATAALYAACRLENVPRSLGEMADVSRVERLEIGRAYRCLGQELGLTIEPADPRRFVPRFCAALELSRAVQLRAGEILDVAAEEGLHAGKFPTSVAAAAIYTAARLHGERRTQREIAAVAKVNEMTIRMRYKEQVAALELHFDDDSA